MAKLIVGCGYLGRRVARLWRATGDDVFALTRSAERAAALAAEGLQPIVGDVTRLESLGRLPEVRSMVFAVGYDRAAAASQREVYVDGLRNVLDALPPGVERLVYISSTGVYGDFAGGWVDEDSPCEPVRESGRICLEAERTLTAHSLCKRAVVLRLAGIYGPGRIPRLEEVRGGLLIEGAGEGYLNLIHVDDAAQAVLAAERAQRVPRTIIVSDGQPCHRGEYYAELSRLIGGPAPRFSESQSGGADRRFAADKRVSNARMLAELDFSLQHPSFRDGLAAILAHGGNQDKRGEQEREDGSARQ